MASLGSSIVYGILRVTSLIKAKAMEVENSLTVGGSEVLTQADEGSGNGIDADTLDSLHASAFADTIHNHVVNDTTGLQSALDGKVDDSQVLTNVPLGAVFTDTETLTSLNLNTNTLTYVDENGTSNNIDLSAYLDEDSRSISSGVLNGTTGIVTFTRDDATTFTLDLSALLDDTNLVTSVAGKSGVVTLVKGDVGLGNVDNTSDLNKPISTDTQTALDDKSDTGHVHPYVPTTRTVNGKALSTNISLTASDVGAQSSGTYNTIIGTDSDINTSSSTIIDNIFVTDGVITSMGTRVLTLGDLGYTGATNANNYTHPSYLGDDFSVDTGALTGATIVSDIDINVTTDTQGHVTDTNGVVSTRTLTLANLGYTGETNATADQSGSEIKTLYEAELNTNAFTDAEKTKLGGVATSANNYTHPSYNGDDISIDTTPLSGLTVISDLDFNVTTDASGHVTDANGLVSTRELSFPDFGYNGVTSNLAMTGNWVLSALYMEDGVVTFFDNKEITLSGLGFTGDVDAKDDQTKAEIDALGIDAAKIGGLDVSVSASTPSTPSEKDIWIDISV